MLRLLFKLTLRVAKAMAQSIRFADADSSIFHSVHHPYEPTFSVWGFHKRDVFTTRFVRS
jgi:hypothetical protein